MVRPSWKPSWKMPAGLEWRVVPLEEARAQWDGWLLDFKDSHIRQSLAWGRHKEGSWSPVFTALFNGPNPLAMGLLLERRAPLGAGSLIWLNGGPAYRKARPLAQDHSALRGYLEGLKTHLGARPRTALRVLSHAPMEVESQLVFHQAGFHRPISPLGTSLTYLVDLKHGLEDLRKGLERNWRNQLKTAEKSSPVFETGRGVELLERYLPIHNEMCRRKNLAPQRLTLPALKAMADDLGEHILFFMISAEGKDGCGGAVWTFGSKAYMGLSAANEWGQKRYLPNAMYWKVIEHLKAGGFESLDVTGIDPKEGWGVYNFKRGLNAEPVEYLGEWDWAASPWPRRIFNLALWSLRSRLA